LALSPQNWVELSSLRLARFVEGDFPIYFFKIFLQEGGRTKVKKSD